ncbi:polyunsaturated fatty acid 5-lipoxygenase isoform X1 [Hydra vulgaris]|uniref:polyunsaturated fatty acid 5-lipoxygenase isoform X1 n=1 Tax=Hydra vulgaris TaxID=6087 RepID=UPI001F5F6AD6|nr:polyunsaturated fatty acid 5-lipoxygenase [Hydra vulgaris]
MVSKKVVVLLITIWKLGVNAEECPYSIYDCKIQPLNPETKISSLCLQARKNATSQSREWYKLKETKNPTDLNEEEELILPQLNQSYQNVALKTMFDDIESRWFSIYYGYLQALNKTALSLVGGKYYTKPALTYSDYKEIYEIFLKTIQAIPNSKHFSLPHLLTGFKDIIADDSWKSNRVFIQRRLAGTCPFFIRKVTVSKVFQESGIGIDEKYLYEKLNQNFNWNKHISIVLRKQVSLSQMILEGKLFVLHHEIFNDLPDVPDILGINKFAKLLPSVSPIVVMVLDDKVKELKMVAIQLDHVNNSKVVTPFDSNSWLQAKGFADIADMAVCQLKEHLVETHSVQELFCNVFKRHLSPWHPVHQIMLPHCEATSPVGALGISSLIDENKYMHKLFNIGHIGARKLINKAYEEQDYSDSDFEYLIKKKGLDDSSKIPYYPYRDDGLLIWNEIKDFTTNYIDIFYDKDKQVKNDEELLNFVNEVSSFEKNGGKYKGFPKAFTSKKDLSTFLNRFIWNPVQHAVNSYPLLPYSGYVPISPTKLYENLEGQSDYLSSLPNAAVTITQEVLTFTLASFRLNQLFDYSKKMSHSESRKLIREKFKKLNTCIQQELSARNRDRFKNGDLTYQYMEPRFIPNSIHS